MINRKPPESESRKDINKRNQSDNEPHSNNDLDIDSDLNRTAKDMNKNKSNAKNNTGSNSLKYSDSPYPPGFKCE